MAESGPQIYLVTPQIIDAGPFGEVLGALLDSVPVACVRLSLATRDEDQLLRAGDILREICHQRDVSLVIDTHLLLVDRLGLDGVHLTDPRGLRAARKALGADAIIGAFCGNSRHDGMAAAEAGADYVSFGPLSGQLGAGTHAEPELFAWWSEMIEIPVVAEGLLTDALVQSLAPVTDFFAFSDEVFAAENPVARLKHLSGLMVS